MAEIYEHLESHRNEPATTDDLELVLLKMTRELSATSQLKCITLSIMLTRGRAKRLVLKAAEPEVLGAHRLLTRRF